MRVAAAKLITFMHTNFNFLYDIKVFFVRHKTFLINTTYFYTTGTIFCRYVFLFRAALKIFSQHESLFWVSHNFFCCHKKFL